MSTSRLPGRLIFVLIAALATFAARADDKERSMRFVAIFARESVLTVTGKHIMFSKGPDSATVWNLKFMKDGLMIYKFEGGADGPLLGIDPKSKHLALFGKPGPTTAWQFKSATADEITPPRPFKAFLYMKIAGEELRLSSDDRGTPILGGKSDVLVFRVEGA